MRAMKFQVASPPLLVVGILLWGSFIQHVWSSRDVEIAVVGSQRRRRVLQAGDNETAIFGNKALLSIGAQPNKPSPST